MLNLFKRQQAQQATPDFPTVDDLPMLDADTAGNVLYTMRNNVEQGWIVVYPPDETHGEWRAWLKITRQWITLTEWQQEVLAALGKEGA